MSGISGKNPYEHLLKTVKLRKKEYCYYDIGSFGAKYGKINYSNINVITFCVWNKQTLYVF